MAIAPSALRGKEKGARKTGGGTLEHEIKMIGMVEIFITLS
jgi:hypothetical protein